MMLKRILAAGIAVFLSIGAPSAHAIREAGKSKLLHLKPEKMLRATVVRLAATTWQRNTVSILQRRTWQMELVMHEKKTLVPIGARRQLAATIDARQRYSVLIRSWQHQLTLTRRRYQHPPLERQFLCIHSNEAAWNNPGISWLGRPSGYYGGLQMNEDFMQRYAPSLLRLKGTANHWTPLEQIWTAAYAAIGPDHRGFYPWPQTAHDCGLI